MTTRDDNVRIAIHDRLHSGCDGTQSRPADLVDAPGRYFLRYARGHGCLPCRILTLASSEHLAHDDFRNILAGDASLRHHGFYGDAAHFMSGSGSESAEEAADRSALGSGAAGVGHATGLQKHNLRESGRISH